MFMWTRTRRTLLTTIQKQSQQILFQRRRPRPSSLLLLLPITIKHHHTIQCESSTNNNNNNDDDDKDWNQTLDELAKLVGGQASDVLATGLPSQISYGFVCGFSSGYALKKVGKAAAVVFGLGFGLFQTLSYNGYINVDYDKLNHDFTKLLDLNSDGKLDSKDGAVVYKKLVEVLSYNLPAGGGFGTGFLMGVRSG